MTEPLTDAGEVDASLNQMNRRGVPDGVRMFRLAFQGWRPSCRFGKVPLQQVAHTEARKRLAALVDEQRRVSGTVLPFSAQRSEQLCSRRPYRAHPYLVERSFLADWAGNLLRADLVVSVQEQLKRIDGMQDDIEQIGQRLRAMIREDRQMQAIQQIPGVGDLTASALVAAVGDFSSFKIRTPVYVVGGVDAKAGWNRGKNTAARYFQAR